MTRGLGRFLFQIGHSDFSRVYSMRLLVKKVCSVVFFFGLFLSSPSWGDDFDKDFEDEEKPWNEIEVQLPPFPEEANLIPFLVGSNYDKKYYIDGNSISVDSDSVIRFAMIIISSAGAQNISFEGMRCATAERRSYAFGRSDKTWSKARSNNWVKIMGGSNNHYVDLYSNFLCTAGLAMLTSAEDVRRVFRKGGR